MLALIKQGSTIKGLVCPFIFFTLLLSLHFTDGYDPLDTSGNITIQWDVMEMNPEKYYADITIHNYQLYRQIEWPPGWSLSWEWKADDQVIWYMQGAEAKEQGICNKSLGTPPPHCCLKKPVIIDLQPGAPFNKQTANCCKGGVLTSMTQDPTNYIAHFQMSVAYGTNGSSSNISMPGNFQFGSPGYTCGDPEEVFPPTKFPEDGGRRWRQALESYRIICQYSQFKAALAPTCCVSLSTFYSEFITFCPNCSCGCQEQPGASCLAKGQTPPVLQQSKDPDFEPPPLVNCTNHMCPIHVHWHVKQSYKEYWRVKITIMNLNLRKNYTAWNLAIEHPNLDNLVQIFSFNYKPLIHDRPTNDTGLFWGIQHYNDVLLHSGPSGNVQTEMLLRKVPGIFTFDAGWTFPKRVYFNGENCVMPLPDDFPRLPKEKWRVRS